MRLVTFAEKFRSDVQSISVPTTANDIRKIRSLYQTLLFVYTKTIKEESKSKINKLKQEMCGFPAEHIAYFDMKSVCDSLEAEVLACKTYDPLDGYKDYMINNKHLNEIDWDRVKVGDKMLECYCSILQDGLDPPAGMLQSARKAHNTLKDCCTILGDGPRAIPPLPTTHVKLPKPVRLNDKQSIDTLFFPFFKWAPDMWNKYVMDYDLHKQEILKTYIEWANMLRIESKKAVKKSM